MVGTRPPSKHASRQVSEDEDSNNDQTLIATAAKKVKSSRTRDASPEKKSKRRNEPVPKKEKKKGKGKYIPVEDDSESSESEYDGTDINSISRQVNEVHGRIVGPARGKSKFDKLVLNVSEVCARLDAIDKAIRKLAVSISKLESRVDEYGESNRITSGKKVKGRSGSKHDKYYEEEEDSEEESEEDVKKRHTFSIPGYSKRGGKHSKRNEDSSE